MRLLDSQFLSWKFFYFLFFSPTESLGIDEANMVRHYYLFKMQWIEYSIFGRVWAGHYVPFIIDPSNMEATRAEKINNLNHETREKIRCPTLVFFLVMQNEMLANKIL